MVDKEAIDGLIKENEANIDYIKELSDNIVVTYTKDLDEIMININKDIIGNNNSDDVTIENYLTELTNALYFFSSRCEFLGLYDDMSKTSAKIAYNKAFSENQIINTGNTGKKPTQSDNVVYAENKSMNENLVNCIYSRSFKIVKAKIDSAYTMVETLKKVLTKRMSENDYSKFTNKGDN